MESNLKDAIIETVLYNIDKINPLYYIYMNRKHLKQYQNDKRYKLDICAYTKRTATLLYKGIKYDVIIDFDKMEVSIKEF